MAELGFLIAATHLAGAGRPWVERPIFGMIRFMSYESTRKKFDSKGYIDRVRRIEKGEKL